MRLDLSKLEPVPQDPAEVLENGVIGLTSGNPFRSMVSVTYRDKDGMFCTRWYPGARVASVRLAPIQYVKTKKNRRHTMTRKEKKAENLARVNAMADEMMASDGLKKNGPEQYIVDIRTQARTYKLEERPLMHQAVLAVEARLRNAGADIEKVKAIEFVAAKKAEQVAAKAKAAKQRRRRE